MDDETRANLRTRLSQAKERRAAALLDVQAHGARIQEIRKALGNPFFYSGKPDDDPQSESKFTGYASHEPALRLIREWQDASTDVKTLRAQLREAGLDSD